MAQHTSGRAADAASPKAQYNPPQQDQGRGMPGAPGENRLDFEISGISLIKYAFPTMLSNLFMNIYGLVDSLFVSNIVGTDGLSALNIVWPMFMITMAISIMVSTGGSALVAKYLGMQRDEKARETFTFLTLFCFAVSAALCLVAFFFRRPLLRLMGADDLLLPLCLEYANVLLWILPAAMVGMLLQAFFVVAGRPNLGFGLSIAGGILNMALDYLLIAVLRMGMTGAALATGTGYLLQSAAGVIYFAANRKGTLYFVRTRWDGSALRKSLSNGMSEMVINLALSVVTIAMNIILMRLSGSDGVAAATIVITMQTILSATYMGYNQGCAPVISYNYGKGDTCRLRRIYAVMLKTIGLLSVLSCALCVLLARPVALIFARGSENVVSMAVTGTYVFAPAFLLMGFNMYGSALFTALNDGVTSAIISLFRTFVFLMIPLLILPAFLGVMGVWLSMPLAEVFSFLLVLYFFRKKKDIYHYA